MSGAPRRAPDTGTSVYFAFSAALAWFTLRALWGRTGEPAVPLDDAFIHLQYARNLAQGYFFQFIPGEGYTSGATSLLWPLLLSPFHRLGLHGASFIWAAWALGYLFLAGLAVETRRLARLLVDGPTAFFAGLAVLAFGAHAWFAASGMEVTALAYGLAVSARLCAEWADTLTPRSSALRARLLVAALLVPLIRPEGALASLLVFATLLRFAAPRSANPNTSRAWSLAALPGPFVPLLINGLLTGHATSATTQVKWMVGNPYRGGVHLLPNVLANLKTFGGAILGGEDWGAELFVPGHARWVLVLAWPALLWVGVRARRVWTAMVVLALGMAMLAPATYVSFLWNRLRYLWPFAFAWLVALACLAQLMAWGLGRLHPALRQSAAVWMAVVTGLLAMKLPLAIDDVSRSASAVQQQQVKLARWARERLPAQARIGVNDTGALAYFSGHPTFDIVGLTTRDEAAYWVAGTGSRFEHYERLRKERPEAFPAYFIVYPAWLGTRAVVGEELTHATVEGETTLGQPTMTAYRARTDLLGSGALPLEPTAETSAETPIDELDVADLESERAHRSDVLTGGGTDEDDRVFLGEDSRGHEHADGGRMARTSERFQLRSAKPQTVRLEARWIAPRGAQLSIRVAGQLLETVTLEATPRWQEPDVVFTVPLGPIPIEVRSEDGRTYASLHYWLFAD